MTLNEWGDFLAGVTAPLALGWIVIGYFQYGQEIRVNTTALEWQKAELRRQAEETARLVKATEKQADVAEDALLQESDRHDMNLGGGAGGGSGGDGGYVSVLGNRGRDRRSR